MKVSMKHLFAAVTLFASSTVLADVLADIKPLQDRWAEVNYALPEDDREKAFCRTAGQCGQSGWR